MRLSDRANRLCSARANLSDPIRTLYCFGNRTLQLHSISFIFIINMEAGIDISLWIQ